MSAGVRVRPMRAADVGAAVALATRIDTAPHWSPSAYLAFAGESDPAVSGGRIAFVAEDESGSVAGFVVVRVIAPEAEIESIVVVPERQRQGIATQLWAAAVARIATLGATSAWLEVRASNTSALGLYARLGFAAGGVRSAYYSGPVEDAILMQRALG